MSERRKRKRKVDQQEAEAIARKARAGSKKAAATPGAAAPRKAAPAGPIMSAEDLRRERRFGVIGGSLGIASFLLTLIAFTVSARASNAPNSEDGTDRERLLDLADPGGEQLLGACLRALGLLCIIGFALFFYRAIRARSPDQRRWVPGIGIAAFVLLATTTVLSYVEINDVAKEFVDAGAQTDARAEQLLDDAEDSAILRFTSIASIVFTLLFGLWVSLTSYEGMRIGILTRFLGIFGIGAGVTGVANILAVSTALFLGWLVSLSLLALGWWPGGRPPAWSAGRAVPWDQVDERTMTIRDRP